MALLRLLRHRARPVIGLVALTALLLPSLAFADPKGEGSGDWTAPFAPVAKEIAQLYNYVFYVALAVFIIVEVMIVYAALRYRFKPQRQGESIPQIHGNTTLEFTWTAIPAIIVAALFVMTFNLMTKIQDGPDSGRIGLSQGHVVHNAEVAMNSDPPANALKVEAIGHQWWWEFRYPEFGITTATMMHVPAGRPVEIIATSADVIHAFWAPQLQGNLDANPGITTATWFDTRAEDAGQSKIFHAQCNEYCGTEHAVMQFRVVVDPPNQFQSWAAQQAAPAQPVNVDLAKQGEALFKSKACIGCHAIAGYPKDEAKGVVGPNLTHLYSRPLFAGGALTTTPDNIKAWLRNPDAVKPGNKMATVVKPGYLTDDQIEALSAYLSTLK